jgi:hypothetical protein
MSKPTHPKQLEVSLMQEGDTNNPSIDKQEKLHRWNWKLKLLEKATMLKGGGKSKDILGRKSGRNNNGSTNRVFGNYHKYFGKY